MHLIDSYCESDFNILLKLSKSGATFLKTYMHTYIRVHLYINTIDKYIFSRVLLSNLKIIHAAFIYISFLLFSALIVFQRTWAFSACRPLKFVYRHTHS